jgi:4-hydroxy-2-oxoglutarate aldolase
LNLSGIFPPIPTPFNADESIAYDKLHANLEKWQRISFAGYVIQVRSKYKQFLVK